MGNKGHSEEEILRVLREAESGDTVVEICRRHGISQQTFYLWHRDRRSGRITSGRWTSLRSVYRTVAGSGCSR